MKQGKLNCDEKAGCLVVIPKAFLDSLSEKLDKILQSLENSSGNGQVGDYITELQAQKLLGRKTTWFWSLRKRGLLPFAKVGNKVFYSRKDIEKLLEDCKKVL